MDIQVLRNVPIFETAPDEILEEIRGSLETKSFHQKDGICRQGRTGGTIYIIKSGQVRVSIHNDEGDEETLGYLGPGDHFGEMSIITGEPVSADVTATLSTELYALDGGRFTELCERNPILYREISRTLSKRLRETNQRRVFSRLGRVIRISTGGEPCDHRFVHTALVTLTRNLWKKTRKGTLCVVPVPVGRTEDIEFLREQSQLPAALPIEPITEVNSTDEQQALHIDIADTLSDCPHRWYRIGGRLDLLVWSADEQNREKLLRTNRFNDVLSLIKPMYSYILVSQVDWPLEILIEQRLPDDTIVFLVDLLGLDAQRRAGPEEYMRFVPEGSRYPMKPEEVHWILAEPTEDRLRSLNELISQHSHSDRRVRVVAVHRKDRPPLDYPRIRSLLGGCVVHLLPFDPNPFANGDGETDGSPTLAVRIGRNQQLARGRIARDLSSLQIGLALGGGGARGIAHVGVIKALEEEGIPVDVIAGSSMGAVVAAAYAEGRTGERLVADMRFHWSKLGNFLLDFRDYTFPRTNLLKGRKIRRMIEAAMKESKIEECHIPLFVVCTDLITGREIVLDRGCMGEAIRASGSLPGIFSPVWWGEYLLVDGAVLNKVPARVLRRRGTRFVIAVNVTPERETSLAPDSAARDTLFWKTFGRVPPFRSWKSQPNILRIISRSLNVSGLHQSRIHSEDIDVEIKPRIEKFDFLSFDQFDDLVEAGSQATKRAIPEIKRLLKTAL